MTEAARHYEQLLTDFVLSRLRVVLKKPVGIIRHPFIDPGSVYDGNVWDWDTYWCTYSLFSIWDLLDEDMRQKVLLHTEGNVRNFFDHQLPDGYIPMMIENRLGDGVNTYLNLRHLEGKRMNMHKPFLASQTCLVCEKKGDFGWAKEYADGFDRYMACYDTYFNENCGLYVWQDDIMIGMDNDPATFGRPQNSTANIFLNSFMTTEMRDLAKLYRAWGMEEKAAAVEEKRERLIEAIRRECWDKRDRFFYSVDVDIKTRKYDWFHQGLGVFWKTLPIKIRVWSAYIPLFAGIATQEEADALAAHYRDESTLHSPYGICTLAKDERMFDLSETNNPSNWLGPIWIVSNYVAFRGLLNYGHRAEAEELMENTLKLLGQDLEKTGTLHEYYSPFDGHPITNGGFVNWNMLPLTMVREMRG